MRDFLNQQEEEKEKATFLQVNFPEIVLWFHLASHEPELTHTCHMWLQGEQGGLF